MLCPLGWLANILISPSIVQNIMRINVLGRDFLMGGRALKLNPSSSFAASPDTEAGCGLVYGMVGYPIASCWRMACRLCSVARGLCDCPPSRTLS